MSTKGTGRDTPETDKFEIAMREKYYAHALGRVFDDALEFARQRECELSEARKHEAVCHCGEPLSAHKIYSSCTNFLEMKEECPNASQNRALLAALKEGIKAFDRIDARTNWSELEPAWWVEWSAWTRKAHAALAAAEPKAEGKG